jgi:hypothetical protein
MNTRGAMLTEADVRSVFTKQVEEAGGVRAMARILGCTPSYVCDMNNGRRAPSPAVLARLGLVKVVRYWPKDWMAKERDAS